MESIKKYRKSLTAILLFGILLTLLLGIGFSSRRAVAEETKEDYEIAHITDLHVIIQKYCNVYSEKYLAATKTTKLLEETSYIAEKLFDDLYHMENAPRLCLITGDLTANGEYENHVWVSEMLKKVTARMRTRAGYEDFQIFVIPGNHDLYNCKAHSYMPSEEELSACDTEEEKMNLLENYDKRSVSSTTSKQFMDLYADFGYCNCEGRANGRHDATCNMADGIAVEYFFESDYWYDDETTRTENLEVRTPSVDTVNAFENSDKDYNIYNEDARFGACSYIARLGNGYAVLGLNGDCRAYQYDDWETSEKEAVRSCYGWHETTGGMITQAQLDWAIHSLENDIANGTTVLTMGHTNFVPHFDSEDEVISLFTYDNWEEVSYVLADAGIHYLFSGHQHAADIVTYVSQKGNVVYDIETGSTISYGVSWRTLTITKGTQNGEYYEDVTSLVHNINTAPFVYGVYKLTSDTANDIPLSADPICDEYYSDLTSQTLGDLTLVQKITVDGEGNQIGVGDLLAIGMYNMAGSVEEGMAGNYVGEKLFDLLDSLTSSLDSAVISSLIADLKTIDFYPFTFTGNEYAVAQEVQSGYGLDDFSLDIAKYLIQYDFSNGQNKEKLTLARALMIVYGGHLSGAHTDEIPTEIQPLLDMLDSGDFVSFVITLLEDALLPQLSRLFDLPVRFDSATPALTSQGFDIAQAVEAHQGTIDGIIPLLQTMQLVFRQTDDNGYSSLKMILGDVNTFIKPVLTDGSAEDLSFLKTISADAYDSISALFETIQHYYKKVINPLESYLGGADLRTVIDDALVDKYVTDAFCKNLGKYGSDILRDFTVDDTEDGTVWGEGDICSVFSVVNSSLLLTVKDEDGNVAFGCHTYQKKTLRVTPSSANGLLPGLISVSFDEDVHTQKNITWYTSVQEFKVASAPDGYIRYSLQEDMSDYTEIKVSGVNEERTLPTIDLGILFINMNHVVKTYNKYQVSLRDLTPGATYYYQLGSDKYGWTKVFRFATAAEGEFSFMAITDIQGSIEQNYTDSLPNLQKAVDFIGSDNVSFIISGGDNVDNGKNIMQYTWLLDGQQEIWANNTLVTTAGNHEDEENALGGLISLPEQAVVNDTGFYYSYDYNSAHFVVLDTNDLTADGTISEEQEEWLLSDLQQANASASVKWTIVLLHKGPYTAGSHAFDGDVIALREQLSFIFAENGVDLVLQGHDHTYSVSEFILSDGSVAEKKDYGNQTYYNQNGVLYINLGTMGDKFYDYIYHEDVSLVKRNASDLDEKLQKYLTEEGLELTETPVFAHITVSDTDVTVKTYTIVDGETVAVDNITLTHVEPEEPSFLDKIKDFFADTTHILYVGIGAGAVLVLAVILLIKKVRG